MPRGKKPYFTPEQDQEIARRYLVARETLEQIADSYGVSTVPVVRALDRQGVERRNFGDYVPWQDTPEARAEIVQLWHQGVSVKKIAAKVRTRDANVSRVLHDAGVTPRFGGRHQRYNSEQTAALVKEFGEGASLASLARLYGGSPITVRGALRRAGVNTNHDRYKRGADHHNWKGGKRTSEGYVQVMPTAEEALLCPPGLDGYVLEHRLVMAKALGRPLLDTETVHHIRSWEKDNNDLSNLQLRQGHHGSGAVFQCRSCGSHDVLAVPIADPAPEGA